jgi:ribosomal protein S6--L-glutamate ligase
MILSFHPIIEADENIICAGRAPDASDLAAIKRAAAVILPQGCSPALYRMARTYCRRVFPNMDVRFDYPGKHGQIRPFRELGIAHPPTALFDDMDQFHARGADIALPSVVKLNWGGQGQTVFRACDEAELHAALEQVRVWEQSRQKGFLVQHFVEHRNRSLRVTVVGTRRISYWRIQKDLARFGTSLDQGACIDAHGEPHLKAAAENIVSDFCARTGLQMAGFDFIFDRKTLDQGRIEPLMLEINYFFGRIGLGGSFKFYEILAREVDRWLAGLKSMRHDAGSP